MQSSYVSEKKMGKIQKIGKAVCIIELAVILWGPEEMFPCYTVFAFAPYLKSMEVVPSRGIKVAGMSCIF